MSDAPITLPRLRLEVLQRDTLAALLAGDVDTAETTQGRALSRDFLETFDEFLLRIQLERIDVNPTGHGWCIRAMVRRLDDTLIGHCGFHGPPEDVGRAEIGYTVLEEYRRQGYAVEAAEGLIEYARENGQDTVFASVSPQNFASLAVVARLGFRQTGVQFDEIDGEEGVFELAL